MRKILFSLCLLLSFSSVVLSQQVQTRSVVTPDGIFSVVTPGHGVTSPEPTADFFFNSNPTPGVLRWVYPNPGASPWITRSVGSGNFGSMDWLGQTLNGERLSFLSSTEINPPVPIFEDIAPASDAVSLQVAAADKNSGCAMAWRNSTTGVDEIRYYDGFSTTPIVLSGVPVQEIRISDDGRRVAVGFTDANGDAAVTVYDENLSSLITLVGAGATFRHHDISGDGSKVLIASGTTNFVYDVPTGTLLHQDGSTVSHDAHSIDQDGDTWGRGGFSVGVWKESGGSYTRILTFNDPVFGFGVYDACDVSLDGSTFVATGRDATNSNHYRVYCWRLTASSATLLWTYDNLGSGSFQDVGVEVSVSDDGKWIVAGSWGAQFNGHPEVLIFDRDAGNVPVFGIDTPGSCFSVDMSGDGQFVVAGTKSVHANVSGNGGEGYSFDLGGQGHWISGTPSIGRTLSLNFNGALGDTAFMGASLGLLPSGVTFSGFTGQWWLDPALTLVPIAQLGPIPASGTLALPVLVPANPALVGLQIFTQGARTGSQEIDNYVRLPITP